MSESTRVDNARDSLLNARLDRLPVWGLSRVVFAVFGLLFFFVYYDIAVIGAALPVLEETLDLTGAAQTAAVTGNLAAYIVGAFVLGNLADRLGRQRALSLSIVVLAVGSLLTALSWDAWSLVAFRFLTGLGMGALISLGATILGELSPARFRGRFTAYTAIFSSVGVVLPTFLSIPLLALPQAGWRILFAVAALSALLLVFLRDRWIPESPRWLTMHGQGDRAEGIVARMEARARERTGAELPPVPELPADAVSSGLPMLQLLRKPYLSRVVRVFLFWTIFYMWIYAYLTFEPTLLKALDIQLPNALLYAGLGDLGFIVAGVVQPFLIDRFERKYLIAGGIGIAIVGLVVLAVSSGAVWLIVGGFVFSLGNFVTVFPAYTYTAEIFPTRARASGMALGDGLGHIGAAVQPLIIVPLLAAVGPRATFGFIALLALVSVVIILGGVRTAKVELTQLAR